MDRIVHLSSAAAAALVMFTALMLTAYLLLSLRLLLPSSPINSSQQLAWSADQQFVQVDVAASSAAAVLIGEREVQALELTATMQSAPVEGNASVALQQAEHPIWLPLAPGQLLVLDAIAGVGMLRWTSSNADNKSEQQVQDLQLADDNTDVAQALLQVTAQIDWTPFPHAGQQPANAEQKLLLAGGSALSGDLRVLTLWQHQAGASLRWYALDNKPPRDLRLLREVSLESIRVLPAEAAGRFEANREISGADITSLLPDHANGAYLGMADGSLLHVNAHEPVQVRSLQPASGTALMALIGLGQGDVLAAHADGSVIEFIRQRDDTLLRGKNYPCASQQLSAMAVDRQQHWLACVGDAVLRLFYLSRSRPVWQTDLAVDGLTPAAAMLAVDNGVVVLLRRGDAGAVRVNRWQFDTRPVLGMQTLWWPQHHPGAAEPSWQWKPQSDQQAIPRFSLMPLLLGTFKAAMLGMLIAVPIALLSAIYTALMLPKRWRERIKPVVEMLESLPTVIVGFIGALWLAPILHQQLLSLLLLLLLLPLSLTLTGYYWQYWSLRYSVPRQLRPLLPYLLFAAQLLLVLGLGMLLQWLLFAGSFSAWLETAVGWTVDMHNALLVGLVLGLGIVPVVFTLVEDALTAVPRQLQMSSLALGASSWQTAWRVMLPAASAGVLAAILIAFGRALGETMIVLMVSGNIPVMESSLLRGLQAIAPTLASEMSGLSPDSVYFQVLLLAALVLFGFTLIMNGFGEAFRSRLRRRYSS